MSDEPKPADGAIIPPPRYLRGAGGRARAAAAARPGIAPCPSPLLTSALLLAVDLLAVGAPVLALLLATDAVLAQNALLHFAPVLALIPLGFYGASLYPGAGVAPVEELRRATFVVTTVYAVYGLSLALAGNGSPIPYALLGVAWLATLVLIPSLRGLLRYRFSDRSWWGVPLLILGAGKTGHLVWERLERTREHNFKAIACLDDDPLKQDRRASGVPVVGPTEDAARLARELDIHHVLVAMPGLQPGELRRLLLRNASTFRNVIVVPDIFGWTSLGLSVFDLGGIATLHARQNSLLRANRLLKRGLDLLLVLPLALPTLPVLLLAALWIMIVDPASPFYAQEREGEDGKRIRVWKLRTMFRDADTLLEKHLDADPAARSEWERFYKLKRDPRILPAVGPILRRTSLDELPQLWNILTGTMSFVGPRPFPYYHLDTFDEEFRELRRSVKPGLTGLWQVSARSEGDVHVQEELDSYYIMNWSLWLDIYLLARTPWAVVRGTGAH